MLDLSFILVSNEQCVYFNLVDYRKFDYKPPGSTDSITITNNDIECLAPGALLNDAIINFYLKYLYFEKLTSFQKQATYLFNVFFYSRLASGGYISSDVRSSTFSTNLPKTSETTDEYVQILRSLVFLLMLFFVLYLRSFPRKLYVFVSFYVMCFCVLLSL